MPRYTRGIDVLYKYGHHFDSNNVVYVGMAGGDSAGVRGRLQKHKISKWDAWTHFSVYQVWDNIREEEVQELEGPFRHLYRYDHRAIKVNRQRGFKKLVQIRSDWFDNWD